ncbi:MAG: hypothetical protein QM621_14995 [Aeromicrobium sp.]|uniref:hypothetical protein n=1 Tax=Aeromicrobium sp. TaxID=1871063 RepID=UPI0039E23C73
MSKWTGSLNFGLSVAGDAARRGAVRGLFEGAGIVLGKSVERNPHDQGHMEGSGKVSEDPPNLKAAVSYDTPYAVAQHENLDYAHPKKGQAKYLESAMHDERDKVRANIIDNIRRELGT